MTAPASNGTARWLPLVLAFITGVTSAGGIGVFVTRDLATMDDLHALETRVVALEIQVTEIRERQNVNTAAIADIRTAVDTLTDQVTELVVRLPAGHP